MTTLNQLELQNLRHLIGAHETACRKLESYAESASDPTIRDVFKKSAQDAKNTKQKLLSLLS